jgi:hypothetical protein
VKSYPSTGKLNCSGKEKAVCMQNKCRVSINHTSYSWKQYANTRLGYSLEYPSDILTSNEGGETEPNFVGFYAEKSYDNIQISIRKTDTDTIQAYLDQRPGIAENGELKLTEVSGLTAVSQKTGDFRCPNCINFHFVYNGFVYLLDMNLPLDAVEHVRQSFQLIKYSKWDTVKQAIENCEVESIMQAHNLEVTVVLKDGETVKAKEPEIDDIFDIVANHREECGEIIMMTE